MVRSAAGEQLPEVVLAVEPRLRGRGIGLALMEALVARARDDGEPGLGLTVSDRNPTAVRPYERLGFARTGRTESGLLIEVLHL